MYTLIPKLAHPSRYLPTLILADPFFLSHSAQGAAQAFEDAGVLGGIFSHPITHDQIPDALRVFEQVRRPRASKVRQRTLEQKALFALPDGQDREARDAAFRAGGDFDLFKWLWEYNAAESGKEAWRVFRQGILGGERIQSSL